MHAYVFWAGFSAIYSFFTVFLGLSVIVFHSPERPPFPGGQYKTRVLLYHALISTFVILADCVLFITQLHFNLCVCGSHVLVL